jgi:hypothetical protein
MDRFIHRALLQCPEIHLNQDSMTLLARLFSAMDTNNDGVLSIEDFAIFEAAEVELILTSSFVKGI